jgi:integrase/recombinase XerC
MEIIFQSLQLKKVCSDIISNLEGEDLVKAYFLLRDLSSSKLAITKNTKVSSNANTFDDFEGLLLQYSNKLKATGKAQITIKNYLVEIKRFLAFLKEGKCSLELLNNGLLNSYLSEAKLRRKLDRNSFSKLVVITRNFLKFLYKNKITAEDLSMDLVTPKKVRTEREYLSENDIKKVEQYLNSKIENYKGENQRDRIIFYLGVQCGLRKSEIIHLDWQDINFNDNRIKILKGKGSKDRVVFFNGGLKNALLEYRRIVKNYEGAVVRGNHGRRITSTGLFNIVSKIFKESGVYRNGLCLHSLRHSYAERLRSRNVDLKTIQALLGHESLETTDRYLHISSNDLKNATL